MAVPSPLPLERFEAAIQADPEVLGMFYFGSLGRGTATRFSDLDIYVWFPDDLTLPTSGKLRQLLELFGPIHWRELDAGIGYVGSEWTQVDIEHATIADLVPSPRYSGATVIKDRDGTLARMVSACRPEPLPETAESAAAVIRNAIADQVFHARHNARGSVWSAVGGNSSECTLTYELIGRLRGRRTYGYRYVEELLSPDEQSMLAAAWPRAPTREENRRAARALWAWTKYVWREAERVIGESLGIELDEESMLAAIERFYA
jgi:hypothetical protein